MPMEYLPANIDLLNEGHFLDEVRAEFETAKQALLEHVVTHAARIRKAHTVVSVEIEIYYEDVEGDAMFGTRTQVSHKRAKSPARDSKLLKMAGEGGEIGLFVLPSGSNEDSPRQSRLAQMDGTGIDLESGQPSVERTLKIGAA